MDDSAERTEPWRIDVPRSLHLDFARITRRRRHRQRALVQWWIVAAARLAMRGYRLPPASSATPAREGADRSRVKWEQDPDELARCLRHIEDAGSSLPLVVRVMMSAYVEHDGDQLAYTPEEVLGNHQTSH